MDLKSMDFCRLLPSFMQTDDADIGLSNAVNENQTLYMQNWEQTGLQNK